jgi:hypothetical protein
VSPLPSRFLPQPAALALHGEGRLHRLGGFLLRGDPLADAAVDALAALPSSAGREALLARGLAEGAAAVPEAPDALRALLAAAGQVPFWVDPARADRGAAVLLRAGPLAGLVLGFRSLVAGYCSPGGNKPLAFSGRMEEGAARRLAETGHFVQATARPGALRPGAEGYQTTLRVRLMHARVRRMLQQSPRWREADWGVPINQYDMAGTVVLFSHALLEGLAQLGVRFTREEREDLMHLWRWSGWLMGVEEELLCATEAEARTLLALLQATQGPPDADSRRLADALFATPVREARTPAERAVAERTQGLGYALSRFLIGDDYADALGYPRSRWSLALPALRAAVRGLDVLRASLPGADGLAAQAGLLYWERAVGFGLEGRPARFELPERLARL